jgi:hypothetical protein
MLFAYASGYELSLGEGKRSDEQAEINALGTGGRGELSRFLRTHVTGLFKRLADCIDNNTGSGIRNSLHELLLALDLNLFKDGKFLDKTEDHQFLGEYWESLHPLCRWGGRFKDGNHYSIEHEGRK